MNVRIGSNEAADLIRRAYRERGLIDDIFNDPDLATFLLEDYIPSAGIGQVNAYNFLDMLIDNEPFLMAKKAGLME